MDSSRVGWSSSHRAEHVLGQAVQSPLKPKPWNVASDACALSQDLSKPISLAVSQPVP